MASSISESTGLDCWIMPENCNRKNLLPSRLRPENRFNKSSAVRKDWANWLRATWSSSDIQNILYVPDFLSKEVIRYLISEIWISFFCFPQVKDVQSC